jgi:hypothetical protein
MVAMDPARIRNGGEGADVVGIVTPGRLAVPVGAADNVRGPDQAPITLVEYGHYQSSDCASLQPECEIVGYDYPRQHAPSSPPAHAALPAEPEAALACALERLSRHDPDNAERYIRHAGDQLTGLPAELQPAALTGPNQSNRW